MFFTDDKNFQIAFQIVPYNGVISTMLVSF